jgi:hypothetical protein
MSEQRKESLDIFLKSAKSSYNTTITFAENTKRYIIEYEEPNSNKTYINTDNLSSQFLSDLNTHRVDSFKVFDLDQDKWVDICFTNLQIQIDGHDEVRVHLLKEDLFSAIESYAKNICIKCITLRRSGKYSVEALLHKRDRFYTIEGKAKENSNSIDEDIYNDIIQEFHLLFG